MALVWREDWLEFSADKELASGSSNLWATNNADYGYKIFHGKLHAHGHEQLATNDYECYEDGFLKHEIIDPWDLEKMFLLYDILYRQGIGPKPLEIFTYKTLMGIKMERAEQDTPECTELYMQRANMERFKYCKLLFAARFETWLMTLTGVHNWGVRDGNLIYIGVNIGALGSVDSTHFARVTNGWVWSSKTSHFKQHKTTKTVYLLPDSTGDVRWSNPIDGKLDNMESFMCKEVDETTFVEENGDLIGRKKYISDNRCTYWTYTPPQPIPPLTEIILDNFESE